MSITITSMFIALMTSTFLILLLNYVLSNKRCYKKLRLDFLSILIFIIILRLCFPSEFFYTITIEAPFFMNPIITFFKLKVIKEITVFNILTIIWIIGCVHKLKQLYCQIKQTNHLFEYIKKSSNQMKISDFLPNYIDKDYPVFLTNLVPSPMVLLFKKAILVPNIKYTEIEISNILHHEATHLNQCDALIKRFIQILVILYWWFPLIYILEKQIDLFLEMRIDSKVSKKMTKKESLIYLKTLLSVKSKTLENNIFPFSQISSFTIFENKNILKFRIEYFLEGNFKYKTKKSILFLLFILLISTNLVIFEPSYNNEPFLEGTYEADSFGHILHKKDGTFWLVLNDGTISGEITNLKDSSLSNLKIIEE